MGDPIIETKTTNRNPRANAAPPMPSSLPADTTPEEQNPNDAAAVEQQTLTAQNAEAQMELRRARRGEGTVVLPGGQRRSAAPLMKSRYILNQHTKFLSDAETILTEDWKREHIGWKYEWPIAESNETKAYLRAEWFKIVPPEAIRQDNPYAVVGDALTPKGTAVAWMRHILVAVPPEVHRRRHLEPAEYALARTASAAEQDVEELNSRFGGGGYRAEVESYSDRG
jgi:hypothetical protein